jgi:hypothetical protein
LQSPGTSCRGIADSHLNGRVWQGEGALNARFFSPLWHFLFSRKRFMVPRGFAIGKIRSSINIKGLGAA